MANTAPNNNNPGPTSSAAAVEPSSSSFAPAPAASSSSQAAAAATTTSAAPAASSSFFEQSSSATRQETSSSAAAPAASSSSAAAAAPSSSSSNAPGPAASTSAAARSSSAVAATSSTRAGAGAPSSSSAPASSSAASVASSSSALASSSPSSSTLATSFTSAPSQRFTSSRPSTSSASNTNLDSSSSATGSSRTLSAGTIGGIAGGAAGGVVLLLLGFWAWRKKRQRRDRVDYPLPPPRESVYPSIGARYSTKPPMEQYGGGNGDESVVGLAYGSRSRSSMYGAGMAGIGSGSAWNEKDGEDGYDHEVDGGGAYIPGLPAHFPNYSKNRRWTGPGQPPSPGYPDQFGVERDETMHGVPSDGLATALPLHDPHSRPGSNSSPGNSRSASPVIRGMASSSSLRASQSGMNPGATGGMMTVDEGAVTPSMTPRSGSPLGAGVGGAAAFAAGGSTSMQPSPLSDSPRRRPDPIQTTGLNDVGPASHFTPSMDYNHGLASGSSSPRSRHSMNPYGSSSYSHSMGGPIRHSYSGRAINLQMPTPLDPSTPRMGYLSGSGPASRSGSIYGLNDFGGYLSAGGMGVPPGSGGSGSGSGSGWGTPSRSGSTNSLARLGGSVGGGSGKRGSVNAGPPTGSSMGRSGSSALGAKRSSSSIGGVSGPRTMHHQTSTSSSSRSGIGAGTSEEEEEGNGGLVIGAGTMASDSTAARDQVDLEGQGSR